MVDAVKHFARTREGDVVRLVMLKPPEYRVRGSAFRVKAVLPREQFQASSPILDP
jgi:hypothetical protein